MWSCSRLPSPPPGMCWACYHTPGSVLTLPSVRRLSDNFLHLGHRIYLDNYYMSLELVKALYDRDTLCCGPADANRVWLPPDVKKTCLTVKQLKRGDSLKRMRDGTLAVTWMNTRVVNLLTNVPSCDADVPRRDKKTGAEMSISRPTAIESYNKHMGGVDLSDQMIISRPTAIENYNKHTGGVDLSDQRVVGPLPLKSTTSTWGESTCQTNV